MNYLTEIKLFYDWLETHPLTANGIVLWHGVMQIASRSGWKDPIEIPSSLLETRTHLERTTIFRARSQLVEQGLLRVHSRGGRSHCAYTIVPFSQSVVLQKATQSATQNAENNSDNEGVVLQFALQSALQSATQNEGILLINETKLNMDIEKENIKEKEMEVADESAPTSTDSKSKREKSSAQKEKTKGALFSHTNWLESIEEPWRGIMQQWLDYKRTRKESYRSEMGAKKCLTMLRNLSGGNAEIAQRIIDQSMANNWAGLFALKDAPPPRGQPIGRQYGQRVGQIIQSEDEQKRQRYIERLKNAGKK